MILYVLVVKFVILNNMTKEILIKSDNVTIIAELEKALSKLSTIQKYTTKQVSSIGVTYDKELTIINID